MEGGPVAALCHALGELGMAGHIRVEAVGQGSAMDSLVVIPDLKRPRILVPAGQRRAASEALQRYSADLSVRQRLQRRAASALIRLWGPRPPVARHQLSLDLGISQGLIAHLSEVFKQPITFSMTIGTARANQKPILQLFSLSGTSLGFVKVGTNDFTAHLVRQEAVNLRELQERRFEHLAVPRFLHSGVWEGLELLVMGTLPTSALASTKRLGHLKSQAEQELHRTFHRGEQPLEQSRWLAQLLTTEWAGEPTSELWVKWRRALDALASNHGEKTVEFTASHGDWTAWNMADHRGRLQVWDWERFARDVPAGFDQLHFAVHQEFRRTGVSQRTLLAALGEQQRFSRTTQACYLADLAGRYLLGEREQQLATVQQKTEVLVTVLETILGE